MLFVRRLIYIIIKTNNMKQIFFIAICLLSFLSCSTDDSNIQTPEMEDDEVIPTNQETEEPNDDDSDVNVYVVGEEGPAGGIVIYVNQDPDIEWQYMEASPVDISGDIEWGCGTIQIFEGMDSGTIGRGLINSIEIVTTHNSLDDYYNNPTQCSVTNNGSVAAQLTLEFEYGGYSDWHLPSRDEGVLLYDTLFATGLSSFDTEGFYWTSTEHHDQEGSAAVISFDGEPSDQHWGWIGKNWDSMEVLPIHIRAVRYF